MLASAAKTLLRSTARRAAGAPASRAASGLSFDLTEEQQQLAQMAKKFAMEEMAPKAAQ